LKIDKSIIKIDIALHRPDSTSVKTSASGTGGMAKWGSNFETIKPLTHC